MIHLKPVNDDAIVFIRSVIDQKHNKKGEKAIIDKRKECVRNGDPIPPDLTYPERCHKILTNNKTFIEAYDVDFNKDKWDDIKDGIPVIAVSQDNDHKDFQDLYDYSLSTIVKYRERLSKDNDGKTATCPICEVNTANTLDHYIPQTDYPLYVVHPRNLIPCCSECNGHKLGKVLYKDERLYWDAFIDMQPTEQYLFCTVSSDDKGLPKCEYDIRQGNIDSKTWSIISKTFEDFQLKERYMARAKVAVNDLRDKIITPVRDNHFSLTQTLNMARMFFTSSPDINNWEYVTKKALLDSDVFKNTVASELTRLGIAYTA